MFDAVPAQTVEGVFDRLALDVEDAGLEVHMDRSAH
jgi:hypothetical protein